MININNSILAICYTFLLIIVLVSCAKKEEKSFKSKWKDNTVIKNVEQIEYDKARQLKVKSRVTTTYFYNNKGQVSKRGVKVEKLIFDENGNRIEQTRFTSDGKIDLRWVYEYDDQNNLIKEETFNMDNQLFHRRTSVYDDTGNELSMKEFDIQFKTSGELQSKYNYKDGKLFEFQKFNPEGKLIYKEKYEYSGNNIISKSRFNAGEKLLLKYSFEYDSLGRETAKIKYSPVGKFSDTTRFTWDNKNRLLEIDEGYIKQNFDYDTGGNILTYILYDKDGYQQQKFKYVYDPRGLMQERVRYDGMNNPVIYTKFEYELY